MQVGDRVEHELETVGDDAPLEECTVGEVKYEYKEEEGEVPDRVSHSLSSCGTRRRNPGFRGCLERDSRPGVSVQAPLVARVGLPPTTSGVDNTRYGDGSLRVAGFLTPENPVRGDFVRVGPHVQEGTGGVK